MSTTISGGEYLARALREEGVNAAFGIVDGSYLALCKGLVNHDIQLFTPRHESSGMHMAGAYARMTGRLGVCIASNGPGVANVLSGVAVEEVEGNRVLLITSCRRMGIQYPDRGATFQRFDQVGTIGAMAKWSEHVPSPDRLGELVRKALRACWTGRPGVVHLDVPEDMVNGQGEYDAPWKPRQYRRLDPVHPDPAPVRRAAELLTRAKLPLIHAGGGVLHAGAFEELAELAELLHAPVTTSWSGRGVLRESHPLAWPMVHIKPVNQLRNAADVVLNLGSRLGETDWWGKAPYWAQPDAQRHIQVDLEEDALGRNRPVDVAVQADIRVFLRALIDELTGTTQPVAAREKAVARLARSRDRDRAGLDAKLNDRDTPLLSAHVPAACRQVFPDDTILVLDGGNTQVWGHFYARLRVTNTLLTTQHMGHLGAGMGQAVGAAAARPGAPVCCIIGDGAFGMHATEVESAVRHGLKVVYVVLADTQWGMVKMTQSIAFHPMEMMVRKKLDPSKTINSELCPTRYDELARSMGAHGEYVSAPDDLAPALRRALDAPHCAVVHVEVDRAKHLWAPGLMHFKDMHQEPAGK